MGKRRSFQEAVRSSVLVYLEELNENTFYFEDDNGPEAVTPYGTVGVPEFERVGRAVVSTHVGGGSSSVQGSLTIQTTYQATARISFVGKNEDENDAADIAFDFMDFLSNPLLLMEFRKNNLSFISNSNVRKIPKFRETRWYDAYVIDVVFAFCLETTQQIDSIDTVEITGNFQSAATTRTNQFNTPD